MCAGLGVFVWLGANILSAEMFHTDAYHALLDSVKTVEFAEAIEPLDVSGKHGDSPNLVDQTTIRLVDEQIAATCQL